MFFHAIVTTVWRNKYKSVCVCVCVCVCMCVCVFGTGEEEKEVNRDRGGLVSVIELRANRHTLRLCAWHYRP